MSKKHKHIYQENNGWLKHRYRKEVLLFRDVAVLWKRANINRHKGATEMKYGYLLDKHILPVIGDCKLPEINSGLLTEFMKNKLQNGRIDHCGGLSASYVRTIMLIVFEILNFAVEEGMCSPLKSKIHKPAVTKNEPDILDVSSQILLENRLFENRSGTNVGILISLGTGLRIGEVCALKWTDIDFNKAILHVRSTVTRIKCNDKNNATKLIIDKPKTKSSIRDIPISKRLMQILVSLYEKRKSEYVISEKCGFLSPRTYEYRFHKILNECGIPSIKYHALRHTFATRCVELGVDVKTLSEILGHSNISITLNTYVHSSMERKREQLEKLSGIYG